MIKGDRCEVRLLRFYRKAFYEWSGRVRYRGLRRWPATRCSCTAQLVSVSLCVVHVIAIMVGTVGGATRCVLKHVADPEWHRGARHPRARTGWLGATQHRVDTHAHARVGRDTASCRHTRAGRRARHALGVAARVRGPCCALRIAHGAQMHTRTCTYMQAPDRAACMRNVTGCSTVCV